MKNFREQLWHSLVNRLEAKVWATPLDVGNGQDRLSKVGIFTGIVNSIEVEDGSGKSFLITLYTSAGARKLYVRCA